jgi:hypothetical protein
MAKKPDQRACIKLDPDNDRRLRKISETNPLKPSLAKLTNLLVRNNAHQLEATAK